jgi:DMSO/TMAO reductase YedYZ heme-binding membrane subunit
MGQTAWFISRGTGLVSLILLTATVVLGVLTSGRFATSTTPRFAVSALHRNISLLAIVFLVVHISTAILDGYVPLHWIDVVIPFIADYHPFWLGLGAVAIDLLLAVMVTSLLRARMPLKVWRGVHWLSYACWPIAVAHGLGIGGADSKLGWVITLNVVCVLAVAGISVWRANRTDADAEARARYRAETR